MLSTIVLLLLLRVKSIFSFITRPLKLGRFFVMPEGGFHGIKQLIVCTCAFHHVFKDNSHFNQIVFFL